MPEDHGSGRFDRDNDLIRSLAHRAGDLRGYYWRWIEAEAKQLENVLNWTIPLCVDERIHKALELKLRRVNQMARDELSDHLDFLEENVEDLKNGSTSDVVKDMWQLEDGINYLRGLVREFRDIRTFIDECVSQIEGSGEQDSDDESPENADA